MRDFIFYFTLMAVVIGMALRNKEYKAQIEHFPEEKKNIYIKACEQGIDRACYYGECSITPIETIKEKACNLPEDL